MEVSEKEVQSKSSRLDHEWVQVLINLHMKYAKCFTGKRQSATAAWDNILKEMQDSGAPKSITRFRIKKKWMNLIAKYKQLKCEANSEKQNAWPYFEQIDRAYSKKQRECDDSSNDNDIIQSPVFTDKYDTKKYAEKEIFMRTLIDMRFKYRSLFTGKKYAAQRGWMVIRNYLPCNDKYTIDQISKVWHNLIQRYKTLFENEPDHSKITWIYFKQLHTLMSQKNSSENTSATEFVDLEFSGTVGNEKLLPECHNPFEDFTIEKPEVLPFLINENDINEEKCSFEVSDVEITQSSKLTTDTSELLSNETTSKSPTSLDDLFSYLKERDEKREEQIAQVLSVMQEILNHLKK